MTAGRTARKLREPLPEPSTPLAGSYRRVAARLHLRPAEDRGVRVCTLRGMTDNDVFMLHIEGGDTEWTVALVLLTLFTALEFAGLVMRIRAEGWGERWLKRLLRQSPIPTPAQARAADPGHRTVLERCAETAHLNPRWAKVGVRFGDSQDEIQAAVNELTRRGWDVTRADGKSIEFEPMEEPGLTAE